MATKRILKELWYIKQSKWIWIFTLIRLTLSFLDDQTFEIIQPDPDTIYKYIVTKMGDPNTVYEDWLLVILVNLPEQYPFKPPKLKFLNKIWHANILDEVPCNEVLSDCWSPALRIDRVTKLCFCFKKHTIKFHHLLGYQYNQWDAEWPMVPRSNEARNIEYA